MNGKKKHDKILTALEAVVRKMHPNDTFHREWCYDRGPGKIGEIDLLRITEKGTWIQYEVKCSRRIVKAREQYKRFCYSFPEQTIKGIYVCTYEIKRS